MNSSPPPFTFEELFAEPLMSAPENEILKSTTLSTEISQSASQQLGSIEHCWANDAIINHVQTSEQFAESTNDVEDTSDFLPINQLENSILSAEYFPFSISEENSVAQVGDDVLLSSFTALSGNDVPLIASLANTSEGAEASNFILLNNAVIVEEDSLQHAVPTLSSEETSCQNVAAKVSKKRCSNSESSSVESSHVKADNKGSSRKKVKLYEKEDKNDPLVKRADYAHSYRKRKKEEKEGLQIQLANKTDALEKAEDVIKELKEKTAKQAEEINSLNVIIKRKDEKFNDLENALKKERNKNSLNPYQTEELLKSVAGVVKGSCPPGVNVQVNVTERLANKKGTTMGEEEISSICSAGNLQKQPCTFTFDIDEKRNHLIAHKD